MEPFRSYVVPYFIRGLCLHMTCAFISLFLCIHAAETIFRTIYFVSMLYPFLSPYLYTLDSILSRPISMLESISSWFELTLTKFTTLLYSSSYEGCFYHVQL